MTISREFAQILIDLLNNNSHYDKQTAIAQLQSAIRAEILYGKIKPESSSIAPFRLSGIPDNPNIGGIDDVDNDGLRSVRRKVKRVIDSIEIRRGDIKKGG